MQSAAATKPRVLFVDDEPMILELLRLTMESMKGDWDTRFVESGQQALSLLEHEPFDLVISDMRMPGMNGVELLNQVMQRYPATGRVILSGYAGRDEIWRCVGATHQFLAKPCPLPAIEATLRRIRSLRERLRSDELQKLVGERHSLPSIPAVYFRVLEVLQRPDCPLDRIAEVVASDPSLTAKLLQLVNSAFFGYPREVSSAREAVLLLGLGTVRSLALTTHLFSPLKRIDSPYWSAESLWHHSLRVGQWARRIVMMEGRDEQLAEQAFTAGVLHDVGKLILADNFPWFYPQLMGRAAKEGRPLVELEQETWGVTHAEVGAYLLDLWGLPAPLVEAAALHHEPSQATELAFSPLTVVHAANVFEAASRRTEPAPAPSALDPLYLDQLSLGDRVDFWRQQLTSESRRR